MTPSNNKQLILKTILVFQTIALVIYTAFAVKNEGWTLFQVIISNVSALNWSGQFNLDFSCYLMLSGLWIIWRNQFKFSSILIALAAMLIGIMFFAPYLIYLLIIEKGDIKKVLAGNWCQSVKFSETQDTKCSANNLSGFSCE